MDAVQRLARLEQRISELAAGKDIDAAHINVLLSPAQQRDFDWQWRQQQRLRTVKRPAAFDSYETLHRQAAALWARCDRSVTRTAAERQSLAKLQAKLALAITAAHAELTKLIAKKPAHVQWLDRAVTDTVAAVDTDSGCDKPTAQQLQAMNKRLFAEFELLPVLVTSRSEHRRVTVEERFDWKTKRDIRLALLRDARTELEANLLEELEREQQAREVRAAKVFLKAFFDAKDAGKNAWSEGSRQSVHSCGSRCWH
jgi:hypothetical protein